MSAADPSAAVPPPAPFPLDASGRVHPSAQTRAAAFLLCAHGTLATRLAPTVLGPVHTAGQVVLHGAYWREMEICSLLSRATSWTFDAALPFLTPRWEAAFLPAPVRPGGTLVEDQMIDLSAFGHAVYGGIRPATLLPPKADPTDPFALALGMLEFESSRLIQGQIAVLKSPALASRRPAVVAAVEFRLTQIRTLWNEACADF